VIAPAGTVDSPHDLVRSSQWSRVLIEANFANLLQYTELQIGHFFAFEEPQLICADLRQFVSKVLHQQKLNKPKVT